MSKPMTPLNERLKKAAADLPPAILGETDEEKRRRFADHLIEELRSHFDDTLGVDHGWIAYHIDGRVFVKHHEK